MSFVKETKSFKYLQAHGPPTTGAITFSVTNRLRTYILNINQGRIVERSILFRAKFAQHFPLKTMLDKS